MGLFDQITCGCSNKNTSCTTDNEPVENVGVGSTSPEESCNVGVGSTAPEESCNVGVGSSTPSPAPKPAPAQSCCSVGVGSSSADACTAARKAAEEQQRILNRKRVLGR